MLSPEYTSELFTAEIDTASYVRDFRDAPHFEQLCRQCPNYAKRWGCPPLSESECGMFLRYPQLKIIAVKLTPTDTDLPLSTSCKILNAERRRLEPKILEEERLVGGRAALFTGMCLYCKDCTRTAGQVCRHPELVRPSLEALGFDLDATARKLLNIEILWSNDGKLPPYLLLIGGIFYEK